MGFYDGKGNWCNDGDGFYDSRGVFRSPGDGFYDSKGVFRSPGDGFYDSKGVFRSPGDRFYDGNGCLQSGAAAGVYTASTTGAVLTVGFLLLLPFLVLAVLCNALARWITLHPYIIFFGYALSAAIICLVLTRRRAHRGVFAILSFAGNFLSALSLVYVVLLYAVPFVIENGLLGGFVEFALTVLICAGAVAVLQFFNYYHEKAVLEFILGILFFLIICVILRHNAGPFDKINQIYSPGNAELFRFLIGFMLA